MKQTAAEVLSALRQEVRDLKESMGTSLHELTKQVKQTNGGVALAIQECALLKQKQDSCPARVYHALPNANRLNDWSLRKMTLIITVITSAVAISSNILIAMFI